MKGLFQGYKNALFRKDISVEELAHKRLEVCRVCPLKKQRMGVQVCGKCGCPLVALARQNEKVCRNWKKYGFY